VNNLVFGILTALLNGRESEGVQIHLKSAMGRGAKHLLKRRTSERGNDPQAIPKTEFAVGQILGNTILHMLYRR